jgi:hypothetical protein
VVFQIVEATRIYSLEELPPVLILHMKRSVHKIIKRKNGK